MKKSKHFRKDVIIARIIFAMLCIVVGFFVCSGICALMIYVKNSGQTQKPNAQMESEVDTQSTQEPPVDSDLDVDNSQIENTQVSYAVTTAQIRLRKEPNTNCETLANVPDGTKLALIETLDGWYKVSYDGVEGYISADYATIETEGGSTSVGSSYVIMLDPGHQSQGDSDTEPNGPGSEEMKARVTSGATGVSTGVKEYELTLEIGLLLKQELENRGFTVLMTRETHDVNISNMERAQMANQANADITVRIHANSFDHAAVNGAVTLAPSTSNPYVGELAEESQKLSQAVIHAYCESTGMDNRGVQIDDTMTGINWCEMPVTIVELGFMSNTTDDTNMQDDTYQEKMVKGIADGIDAYFGL